MKQNELIEALAYARSVMIDAGEIALRYFRQALVVDNKQSSTFDPVTCADREVEAFLRQRLVERYPDLGVTGEEQGFTPGAADQSWVIDPIDGTRSFISGLPTWGMLLGLLNGETVFGGMMYQPYLDELYIGGPDGAYLFQGGDQRLLQTRRTTDLSEAILFCTDESMFEVPAHKEGFRRVSERVKLRRFGADCYAYCMLAHGQIDLVVEDSLQPYDIIPLIPVIEAAGGVVTDRDGKTPLTGGFVVAAANRNLHRQALDIINQ